MAMVEEGWFPVDADEAELKRRFRALAAEMHPDRYGPGAPADAVEKFQELSEEYQRLLNQCETAEQQNELQRAWIRVGGIAGGIAAAVAEPTLAATGAAALGSVALLSLVIDVLTDDGTRGNFITRRTRLLEEAELDWRSSSSSVPTTIPQLYQLMDEAIERGSYEDAAAIKDRIDARKIGESLAHGLAGSAATAASGSGPAAPAVAGASDEDAGDNKLWYQKQADGAPSHVQEGVLRVMWTDFFAEPGADAKKASKKADAEDREAHVTEVHGVLDGFRQGWSIALGGLNGREAARHVHVGQVHGGAAPSTVGTSQKPRRKRKGQGQRAREKKRAAREKEMVESRMRDGEIFRA